ncbi:HIT family protein [Streptomyces hesseae]|uniref:HIT family protein n=1 Tax=Streptomyces hesseae TaxID=3075519 RepID=UPI003F689FCD
MREPIDLGAYAERARTGPCFICACLSGRPGYEHHLVADDGEHVAFLDRWPTVPGKVLVAPKRHLEHVVRGLDEPAYVRLMLFVRRVALAMEEVCRPERTYLYSLGSQQGNAHVHWHIAGLPSDTPYERQQFHALMAEHGVIKAPPEHMDALAERLRQALTHQP